MSTIRTDLGDTRDNAQRLRFARTTAIVADTVQDAIENVQAQTLNPPAPEATPVAATPYAVQPEDRILDVSIIPAVINLDASALHEGHDLVIKDTTGTAAIGSGITINGDGAEQIDGQASVAIENPYGAYRLRPVAAGWRMDP